MTFIERSDVFTSSKSRGYVWKDSMLFVNRITKAKDTLSKWEKEWLWNVSVDQFAIWNKFTRIFDLLTMAGKSALQLSNRQNRQVWTTWAIHFR